MTNITSKLALLSVAGLMLAAGCSAGGSSSPGQELPEARLPSPQMEQPMVDSVLMAQLTAELERVLAEQGTAKRTAAAPTGPGSEVQNFHAYLKGVEKRAYFSYRNQGDYDMNGIVTIADLTPIGIHFGKGSQDPDWAAAQAADGDGNGLITIADVTPIGQNFGGRVDGFELQLQDGGEFEAVQDYPRASFTLGSSPIPYLDDSFIIPGGGRLRVVPYSDETGPRQYGPPSNIEQVPLPLELTVSHPQYRVDPGRGGASPADFPDGASFNWDYAFPAEENTYSNSIVCDVNQNIYIGTSIYSPPGDQALDGYLYSFSRTGDLRWRVRTPSGVITAGVINSLGNIIVGCYGGEVICFSSDGRVNWIHQADIRFFGSMHPLLRADDSMVFVGIDTEIENTVFAALDRDGNLLWEYGATKLMNRAPTIIDDNGTIACVGNNDDILYLTSDGNGMPTPILNDMGFTNGILRADNRAIFLSFSQRIYSLEPPAGLLVWYDHEEDVNGGGSYDPVNETLIFPSYDFDATGRITGMSRSLVWFWDFEFDSTPTGDVLVDRNGDVVVSVSGAVSGGATGVWCIGSDQASKWFYDTQGKSPGSPIANGDGKLVLTVSDPDTLAVELLAIGTPL